MYRLLVLTLLSSSLFAGGWGFHLISTKKALESLPEGQFKNILKKNKRALLNGSLFPDGGYVFNYGHLAEWTHHDGFLNSALKKLEKGVCQNFSDEKCQQELTFVFGVVAHIVEDYNFDRYFLRGLADAEFNGNLGAAQHFSDLKFDTVVIKAYGLDKWMPSFYQPKDLVYEIYQEQGYDIEKKDISEMQTYQRVLYSALISYSTHSAERISKLSPWGTSHFKLGKGGVEDTAKKISKLWLKTWEFIKKENQKKLPQFKTWGRWPDNEIELESKFKSRDD